jgi:hypothetical protein
MCLDVVDNVKRHDLSLNLIPSGALLSAFAVVFVIVAAIAFSDIIQETIKLPMM